MSEFSGLGSDLSGCSLLISYSTNARSLGSIVEVSKQHVNIDTVMPELLLLAFAIDYEVREKWQLGDIITKAQEEQSDVSDDKKYFTEILKWALVENYHMLHPLLKHLPLFQVNKNDTSLDFLSSKKNNDPTGHGAFDLFNMNRPVKRRYLPLSYGTLIQEQ